MRKLIGALLVAWFIALVIIVTEASSAYIAAHVRWADMWYSNWLVDHVQFIQFKSIVALTLLLLLPGVWLIAAAPLRRTRRARRRLSEG